jgi:beta-galactosidase GanA
MRGALRRAETDDTQLDGPQIPPLPPLRERPANGWFFRGESGDPLMVLSLHSASAALQRFFATPLQHIESYTVGGGSRWTIDRSPVYAAFQADPGARRVGWDGWCGHLIRDLHSMGGTKKENVVICLEHPGIRQAISEYIRLNIPGLHANPELLYDIMAYELSYMCYCDRSRAMFYKWLGARHGTVADANGKWGTNYRSFADVTPPPVKDSRPLADTNRAVWYDWARFNMDRFTDHLLWVRQEIRRISPRIPLAAGGSSYMLSGHASTSGIDEERIVNEVDDLIIHEGGDSTMGLDLQLALSDTPKPLADPEMSLQGVEYLLPHFLHGKSVAQIYHWPAQPANEFYSNNSSSIAHGWRYSLADVDELLRVALDVRRLNREIASFVETPAEVAILYSQTSTIQIPAEMVTWRITPYLAEMRKVYQGSLHLDTRTTFITERQVLRGRLDRYKLVIVPGARNVPAGVAKRLWEYASNGGHVVVTPESLLGDEYNRPQPYLDPVGISILRTERPRGAGSGAMVQGYDQSFAEDVSFEAAPVETLVPAGPLDLGALQTEGVRQALAPAADLTVLYRFAGGDPAIVRRPFGQGVVTYVAASLQEQAYARLFDAVFDAARVVRPVRVRSASPVEARYATLHGRKLLSVINLASKPVDITVEAPVRALIELRGGRRFDGNRVTIPERQTYILELQEGTEQL